MELWVDTSDISLIKKAQEMGCLYGITTNPIILSHSDKSPLETLQALLDAHLGPVTAQVTSVTAKEMIKQGKALHAFSKRLLIKVPVSLEGFKAIYALSQEGITVMATAIYDFIQAISAFQAGAIYGAIYIGRMEDAGLNPIETMYLIQNFLQSNYPSCKLLAASIRSKKQLLECIQTKCGAITLKKEGFSFFMEEHSLTTKDVKEFKQALPEDWILSACKT
jgi:TalC/MipB family fructose-6-phosphate aldolase